MTALTPAAPSDPRRPFDLGTAGAGLPVAAAVDRIRAGLGAGALVVTAPPGSGKTTLVPLVVAEHVSAAHATAEHARPHRVVLTQPRRVAVRAAARRLAGLDGGEVGGRIGYTVRGERRVGPETLVEVVTPGVLLRRLLADPGLDGVGAVVLDEIHERSLDADLLLGMLTEVRALRPDLALVAMSATLDAAAVAAVLGTTAEGEVPVVDTPAALHPLEIRHDPPAAARLDARGVTREFLAHVAEATARAHGGYDADALVFLPGAREVDDVVSRLRSLVGPGTEVLALHGRLPAREQDRATSGRTPGDPPRVVVTTSIAESSLTVPGVRLVVDAGLAREPRRDRMRDMAGLVTVGASRASADQRAGRAARQGPGTAVRLYSETDDARMPAAAPPEIATADLTDAALLLAAWGTPRGEGLALLDAPPAAEIEAAQRTLAGLGLVDDTGRATAEGRRIAALPIGVREARALLAGAAELGSASAAAEVVAALADDHRPDGADLERLLRDLRAGRAPGAQRWRREADRLARLVGAGATSTASAGAANGAGAGVVLALGRPERVARAVPGREGAERTYLLASGTRAALPPGSALAGQEWLAVWDVQRAEGRAAQGTGAIVRAAAPLGARDAERLAGGARTVRRAEVEGGTVRVRSERRLGAVVLASTPVAATPQDVGPALLDHVRERGLDALTWSDATLRLRGRLALVHRELGEPWPDVSEASLTERLEDWLGPDLGAARSPGALARLDLAGALRRLLPWPQAGRLDDLAPERLAIPSGRGAAIDYAPVEAGGAPAVSVKLQELFGLASTPSLVDGRVPVVVHLLSPAGRPLAVTADLRSFWDGPYQEVRKEMRGRYPKHPWPEDPWTAPATARTARRPGR